MTDLEKIEKRKEYYKNNKEKINNKAKKYYEINKEKISERHKEYYENNKNQIKEYLKINNHYISKQNKDRYQINKEKINEYSKEYYKNNKKKISDKSKEYNKINKEKNSKREKKYRKNNKEKINNRRKQQYKNRKEIDPLYKLRCNIGSLILLNIKKQGYTKKSKTFEILGCTFEEFKQHLERQFTKGMNWENQGKWHLDHIYPVSLAKDEQELIRLNHYTNFQPMWAKDNINKGNKIITNTQIKLI